MKPALLLVVILCASCASLPQGVAQRYKIYEAHAIQLYPLGPFSYLRASSFVMGFREHASFQRPQIFFEAGGRKILIAPSRYVTSLGFSDDGARDLAARLENMLDALPRYSGEPVPTNSLKVFLLAPSEKMSLHRSSFSFTGKHRVNFALGYDVSRENQSTREIVKTFAHELLHVTLAMRRGIRRLEESEKEEQAANAVAHCVEVDVFGTTNAPELLMDVPFDDRTPIERSISAGYASDTALKDLFGGRERIESVAADELRSVCVDRVKHLAEHAR